MSKQNLEILDFEDNKKTNAGKPYVRFQTNDGWMSCFDSVSNAELIKQCGTTVECEVGEANGFKNIKKFLGLVVEVNKPHPHSRGKTELPTIPAKECHLSIEQVRSNAFDLGLKMSPNAAEEPLMETVRKIEAYLLKG